MNHELCCWGFMEGEADEKEDMQSSGREEGWTACCFGQFAVVDETGVGSGASLHCEFAARGRGQRCCCGIDSSRSLIIGDHHGVAEVGYAKVGDLDSVLLVPSKLAG